MEEPLKARNDLSVISVQKHMFGKYKKSRRSKKEIGLSCGSKKVIAFDSCVKFQDTVDLN